MDSLLDMEKRPSAWFHFHELSGKNGIFAKNPYFIRLRELSNAESEKNPCQKNINLNTITPACMCRQNPAVTITIITITIIPRRHRRSRGTIIIRGCGIMSRRRRARYSMRWRRFRSHLLWDWWFSCRWYISVVNVGGCPLSGWDWSWHIRCGDFPSGGAGRTMRM